MKYTGQAATEATCTKTKVTQVRDYAFSCAAPKLRNNLLHARHTKSLTCCHLQSFIEEALAFRSFLIVYDCVSVK